MTPIDEGELVLLYDTDVKEYFMTVSEFLTDLHLAEISQNSRSYDMQMHVDFCWSVLMYTSHILWLFDVNMCHVFYNIFLIIFVLLAKLHP